MNNTTPFLPGLHLQSLRKKPRSTAQKKADEMNRKTGKSLLGLKACFGRFVPEDILQNNAEGEHSRHRIFSKETTFWAFFSQTIDTCEVQVENAQKKVGFIWKGTRMENLRPYQISTRHRKM